MAERRWRAWHQVQNEAGPCPVRTGAHEEGAREEGGAKIGLGEGPVHRPRRPAASGSGATQAPRICAAAEICQDRGTKMGHTVSILILI